MRRKKADDEDNEVLLIDGTTKKTDDARVKPRTSQSEDPQRYVHFVDINTYHDV